MSKIYENLDFWVLKTQSVEFMLAWFLFRGRNGCSYPGSMLSQVRPLIGGGSPIPFTGPYLVQTYLVQAYLGKFFFILGIKYSYIIPQSLHFMKRGFTRCKNNYLHFYNLEIIM